MKLILVILCFLCIYLPLSLSTATHNNNWAIIISTSKYYFNYRHNSNALTIYKIVKEQGIPDNQIILMLPEDIACNQRNPYPGTVYNTNAHVENLYDDTVEVDYRGDEVSVEAFLRLITGRHTDSTANSRRLNTNEKSNVFIYMSGHGGDGFIKFRDSDILSAEDVAKAVGEMYFQRRFNEMFFMLDTCQASTLLETIDSPGVITLAASRRGENSYSHGSDNIIGTSLVDKMTFFTMRYYEQTHADTNMEYFLKYFTYRDMGANAVIRTDLAKRSVREMKVRDFLGNFGHTEKKGRSNYVIENNYFMDIFLNGGDNLPHPFNSSIPSKHDDNYLSDSTSHTPLLSSLHWCFLIVIITFTVIIEYYSNVNFL